MLLREYYPVDKRSSFEGAEPHPSLSLVPARNRPALQPVGERLLFLILQSLAIVTSSYRVSQRPSWSPSSRGRFACLDCLLHAHRYCNIPFFLFLLKLMFGSFYLDDKYKHHLLCYWVLIQTNTCSLSFNKGADIVCEYRHWSFITDYEPQDPLPIKILRLQRSFA